MDVWSPIRFNCGREMANRFAIAPMTTDSSHEDGTATDHELEFVRRRAAERIRSHHFFRRLCRTGRALLAGNRRGA